MSEKNGGSAFPETWTPSFGYSPEQCNQGMTLRDYFAAKAIARYTPDYIGKMHDAYEQIAMNCYAIADAMLKAREQQ